MNEISQMIEPGDSWATAKLDQAMEVTDCIVTEWEMIDVSDGVTTHRFLYGIVVIDYKGRFTSGKYVFTSAVTYFDKEYGLVQTLNSTYALKGPGAILNASPNEAFNMKRIGLPLHTVKAVNRGITLGHREENPD